MSPKKTRYRLRHPPLRLVYNVDEPSAGSRLRSEDRDNADRLFRRFDHLSSKQNESLWGIDVLLSAPPDSRLLHVFTAVSPKMASLGFCPSIQSAESFALHCDGTTTLLALDVDQFDSRESVIDWLLGMRDRNPQLTVLLLSSEFAKNADSLDPRSIADGALRTPADAYDLEDAMESALKRSAHRLKRHGTF
ncbi:hypothetical protein [Nioella ostreopsis]|uniref:hypothetical protein n=1 Tax=Nioella ostreopsis TaxID=2448479 RepID=UPI000FDA53A4|nr:hypothetical protein [Nioella ostreopsis]